MRNLLMVAALLVVTSPEAFGSSCKHFRGVRLR
jgi:hypothetical protein